MKNLLTIITVYVAVLILFPFSSSATKWRVNNNPTYTNGCSHCFSELQDAVDNTSVSQGDTIYVEASTAVYAPTTINKKLVIIGTGYFLNENVLPSPLQHNALAATVSSITFVAGSDYSVLKGIAIDDVNASWSDITFSDNVSHITIERCYIVESIVFNNTASTISDIVIKQCYVDYDITTATNIVDPILNLTVSNCYIDNKLNLTNGNINTGTVTHNVIKNGVGAHSGVIFFNNIFKGGTFAQNTNSIVNVYSNLFIASAVPAWLAGGTNIAATSSTVFGSTGTTDGILKLNPSGVCPQCYQAYPGTEQFGMFGGSEPYLLSGIPNVPTIYKLQSPPSTEQGGTLNVTISTKSNN